MGQETGGWGGSPGLARRLISSTSRADVSCDAKLCAGCALAASAACRLHGPQRASAPAPPTPALQTYVLKQLRINSDDVRLLRSYPAPWQVNLARPDNPSQVRVEWEQALGQRQGLCKLQWEGQVGMVPQ